MKIYLTILILFISVCSVAQMKVEDIKTEKDALIFLDAYYFKGERKDTIVTFKKSIDTTKVYYIDSIVLNYLDSMRFPKWIKRDFNGDKKMDFIFCGLFNQSAKVIAFMSNGRNKYSNFKLSFDHEEPSLHFIYPIVRTNYFAIGRVDDEPIQWDFSYQFKDRFRIDTVKYSNKVNGFIDFDYSERPLYSIDTIRYQFLSFKKFGNDKVQVYSNGIARLTRMLPLPDTSGRFGFGKHIFEKRISKDTIQRIFDFVSKMPLLKYRKEYEPVTKGWLDGFSILTEFSNKNGFYKPIFDRLQVAPLSLQYFYSLIFELRKSTDWKLVEIIAQ